ncbi:SRPBCC family protein [Actinomycetospora sp. TBRC 11914]|uniref:SRPBCC family protein n=1 Tax=Actinomycetospora sp. TBRC 11914 TaxID=2729387 RepID=UPI00145DCA65|nr:SRPBCC family protein [Actinomycetospora sp. TBRC 11914]NMO93174.1 ATPase [Actinomycetospora sp. TBRC 11914]
MTDTTSTIPAIRREVTVDVGRSRAFEIFTADMTSWWPPAHHIGSAPIAEIVVEPFAGGRWYTRHEDGTETSTGAVTAWEPPERLAVTWQIGADWRFHDDLVTTVEVRFVELGPESTRVELEHRDLEAFGEAAEAMRGTFESDGAWTATLQAYAAVAGAAS